MKRFSLFLMIVLLVSAIFISCSAEPAADATSVVEVAISLPKALSVSSVADATQELPQVDALYWFYTAKKADTGFKTGATGSTLTAIRTDGPDNTITKGLPAVIGYTGQKFGSNNEYLVGQPFSTGPWRFSFYGYKELNTDGTPKGNPIYQYVCSDTQNPNVTVNYTESESMIGGDANITLEIANDTRVSGKVIIENIVVDFGPAVDSNATYTLTVTASGISDPIATSVVSNASSGSITFFSEATNINVSNTTSSGVIAPRFYTLSFVVTKSGDSSNTYASGEISIHARLGYNVTIYGSLSSLESVAYVAIHNQTQGLPQAQNENVFTISSEDELRAFAAYVNQGNTCEGMTINLINDIGLNGAWTPIGNGYRGEANPKVFSGTFNGNNHTITGLTSAGYSVSPASVTDSAEYTYGLFGYVKDGIIEHVSLANVAIAGGSALENGGAVVGYLDGGTVNDCHVLSGSISGFNGIGGVVGRAYGTVTIDDCSTATGVTVTGSKNVAGIVGFANPTATGNKVTITGNTNAGAVTRDTTNGNAGTAGGVAGIVCYGTGSNTDKTGTVIITGNTNAGALSGEQSASIAKVTSHYDSAHCTVQE